MTLRDTVSEDLLLDAIGNEVSRRAPMGVLLVGMQACSTVSAANRLVGSERVVLLHLDRSAGAVGCGLGNRERFIGNQPGSQSDDNGSPDDLAEPGSDEARFAIVAVNVEAAKSYRLLREIVRQTANDVDPDGVVLVAGPKKGGAEVAAGVLREQFASVELVTYRKGHRLFRAMGLRPPAEVSPEAGIEEQAERVATVALRGHDLHLIEDDRIFARGRLDPATRVLAEVFEIPTGAAVLDLGCGSGVLGILAALVEPSGRFTLVDSDPLAVEVSRRNAALNGVPDLSVQLSDVLADLPGQTFDVVLMNPPFHQGRVHAVSIAERFLTEASRALRPGARLYVVCNRFLPYERTLGRLLGAVQEVAGDRRFKVLLARRGLAGG